MQTTVAATNAAPAQRGDAVRVLGPHSWLAEDYVAPWIGKTLFVHTASTMAVYTETAPGALDGAMFYRDEVEVVRDGAPRGHCDLCVKPGDYVTSDVHLDCARRENALAEAS